MVLATCLTRGGSVPPVGKCGGEGLISMLAVLSQMSQITAKGEEAWNSSPVPTALTVAVMPCAAAGLAGLPSSPRLKTRASSPMRVIQRVSRLDRMVYIAVMLFLSCKHVLRSIVTRLCRYAAQASSRELSIPHGGLSVLTFV